MEQHLEEWKAKNRLVLSKSVFQFPRLFKTTVEDLGICENNNILAGFRACDLVLFNPQAVLGKIVRKGLIQEEKQTAKPSMTATLIDYLHQLKTDPTDVPKRGEKD